MAKAKASPVPTRGERNNNPGNIDYSPRNPWIGKLPRDLAIESRFERFDSPLNGGRAAVRLVDTYKDRGINSIRGVISAWAPPNENRTNVYVDAVARAVGVDPDAVVNLTEYRIMRPLIEAIIRHENGRVIYSPAEIDEMLRRGGIVNPAAPAVPPQPKKQPVTSAALTTAATVGAPGAGVAYIVQNPALQKAVEDTGIPWLVIGFGVIGFAAAVYGVWYAYRAARPKPEGA